MSNKTKALEVNQTHCSTMPEMAELILSAPQARPDSIQVHAELRCGPTDISSDDAFGVIYINITGGKLLLRLEKCSIKPGKRYGEDVKSGYELRTIEYEEASSKKLEGSVGFAGKIGLDKIVNIGGSLEGKAQGQSETRKSHRYVGTETERSSRVKARGGYSWELSELHGSPLNGSYFMDDALCEITPENQAISFSVRGVFKVLPKNIQIEGIQTGMMDYLRHQLSNNKLKIAQLLVSKGLARRSEVPNESHHLILSEASLNFMIQDVDNEQD